MAVVAPKFTPGAHKFSTFPCLEAELTSSFSYSVQLTAQHLFPNFPFASGVMSSDAQTAVPRSYGTSQETDCCTDGSEYQIGAAIVVRRNLEGLDYQFCACTEIAQPFKAEMSETLGTIDDEDVEAQKSIIKKELNGKWLLLQKKE